MYIPTIVSSSSWTTSRLVSSAAAGLVTPSNDSKARRVGILDRFDTRAVALWLVEALMRIIFGYHFSCCEVSDPDLRGSHIVKFFYC